MGKIIMALFLGFLIGIGCRYFDIPLPGPPKFIGALVVLSVTSGYVCMDTLLTRHTKKTGSVARRVTTAQCCGGPTRVSPSRE